MIKWLNKELNDAQMLPGGTAASTVGTTQTAPGTATFLGGVSSVPGKVFGGFNASGAGERADTTARAPSTPGAGRDMMFTAGIRDSTQLAGIRGLQGSGTLDLDGDHVGHIPSLDRTKGTPLNRTGQVTMTPDPARMTRDHQGGRDSYVRIVTPESADAPGLVQTSRRSLSAEGKRVNYEDDGDILGERIEGDPLRGIPAF